VVEIPAHTHTPFAKCLAFVQLANKNGDIKNACTHKGWTGLKFVTKYLPTSPLPPPQCRLKKNN
jgi:hypothetical protein